MLRLQWRSRLGQYAVEAKIVVNALGGDEWTHQWPGATGIDRQLRMPGQRANPPRVALGQYERQISRHRDNAEHLQLTGCRQRQ